MRNTGMLFDEAIKYNIQMIKNAAVLSHNCQALDEPTLIKYLKEHRKQAFDYLYKNYSGALYAVILQIVCDKQLSEDILQESFVKIWSNIHQYNASKSRLFTWMHQISRNCAIDVLRSKQYKKTMKTTTNLLTLIERDGTLLNVQIIGLRKIVNTLPEEYSNIIALSYFSGYTQEEIAECLGLPVGTIKTKKRLALVKLRNILHRDIKLLA